MAPPVRAPFSAGGGSVARTPARALRVGNIANAERRDQHGDHDQFLYHLGVLLQGLVRSGDSAHITDPNVRQ